MRFGCLVDQSAAVIALRDPTSANIVNDVTGLLLSQWLGDIQWGKKVFSQPPIVQVLPLKKMREACKVSSQVHFNYDRENEKKNPENHIVGFFMNLFANYGGK